MLTKISLDEVKTGEEGIIINIRGGRGVYNRLKSMGIRVGIKIIRVNSNFGSGPVVLRIGRAQTALGFGVAHKIIVEVER
ncbi:MAG: ferrous iron transport protein A [Candidatus Omnitrophica bacterium]|nr:ferrous iron transport protein A [Candidatus Omnitrophota bacterium]MCK5393246.1 ferrous iron transport protein A [Candidatus Omnitrophota bacterium]